MPLVLPQLDKTWSQGVMRSFVLWVAAQLHWLGWAYLLEFQGMSVHLEVWLASLIVLAANVQLMIKCLICSRPVLFTRTAL